MSDKSWNNRIIGTGEESPGNLLANPRNFRLHPKHQQDALEGVLNEVGWVDDVIVNQRTGRIVDGHLRVSLALKRNEMVPVKYVELSEAEEALILATFDPIAALAVADAALLEDLLRDVSTSEHAVMQMLADMAEREGIVSFDDHDGLTDADEVPEPPVDPITKPGDLWLLGRHRLLCGDSTNRADVDRLMNGEKAALMVTSPPYNQKLDTFKPSGMQKESPAFVNRMASAYDDSMPEPEYQQSQVQLLELLKTFMTPNASMFYNHKIRYRDKRIVSPMEWLSRLSFPIRQEIIWDRGSSITLNARMFIPADERIYWLRVGDDFLFNDTTEIKSWSTVWEIGATNDVSVSAAFATEIPRRCIRAASNPDDIVIEPYAGSGTTLIAAEEQDRTCNAIERNPAYCDVIVQRWENYTGQTAHREAAT